MARFILKRLLLFGLMLAVAGCWNTKKPENAPPAAVPGGKAKASQAEPMQGAPKQLIIMYSGDTLSIPEADRGYVPPQGGLPALAHQILSYESMIMDFTRARVTNEGGDASGVKADYVNGLLGDSPFLLLDYGGWERPNDKFGAPYAGLYLLMCRDLHYTAVANSLYERLKPEIWAEYKPLIPKDLKLLATAGFPSVPDIPTVRLVTRKVHDDTWGVVAVPLPKLLGLAPDLERQQALERLRKYIELAADEVSRAKCRFSVLLMPDGPDEVYRDLAHDKRFTVVIGATKATANPEGHNDMPEDGALLLPALEPGARELGVCHLYYPQAGDRPLQYYLLKQTCLEHANEPYPFRKQAYEAAAKHKAQLEQAKAAAK